MGISNIPFKQHICVYTKSPSTLYTYLFDEKCHCIYNLGWHQDY